MVDDGNKDAVTYTVDKDGALVAKGAGGETRYVKESDLLAVKGSKESLDAKVKELEAKATGGAESKAELETARQKALQAEAKVSSLEEKIAAGTATAAERDSLKQQLAAAKSSGEGLNTKLLELQRTLIVGTYGVPAATVEKKSLAELEVYAQALADVTGKKLGNYAAGGGGGGAPDLSGKSPMELARMAYEAKK